MSNNGDDLNCPPPSSQSHFAKFENFTPDDDASFDHEFSRLASSQEWIPGSQTYTRERTIAMREELKLHYFSQSQTIDEEPERELTDEEKLQGYQALCHEVGIPPSDSMVECKKQLKATLVNIVDLIDARRTSQKVKVWEDFEAFRNYTLRDEHRIRSDEAKKNGGYLASLLQDFGPSRSRRKRGTRGAGVLSGRVMKRGLD